MNFHTHFAAYNKWKLQQSCINCGLQFTGRPKDSAGNYRDVWATETQCMACYAKFGPEESKHE